MALAQKRCQEIPSGIECQCIGIITNPKEGKNYPQFLSNTFLIIAQNLSCVQKTKKNKKIPRSLDA